jgi:hypothetical protein
VSTSAFDFGVGRAVLGRGDAERHHPLERLRPRAHAPGGDDDTRTEAEDGNDLQCPAEQRRGGSNAAASAQVFQGFGGEDRHRLARAPVGDGARDRRDVFTGCDAGHGDVQGSCQCPAEVVRESTTSMCTGKSAASAALTAESRVPERSPDMVTTMMASAPRAAMSSVNASSELVGGGHRRRHLGAGRRGLRAQLAPAKELAVGDGRLRRRGRSAGPQRRDRRWRLRAPCVRQGQLCRGVGDQPDPHGRPKPDTSSRPRATDAGVSTLRPSTRTLPGDELRGGRRVEIPVFAPFGQQQHRIGPVSASAVSAT